MFALTLMIIRRAGKQGKRALTMEKSSDDESPMIRG
jgi:hypothetical protein